VGADRKGPLAALVVVALIAVILLVTSVRSQAATERHVTHRQASSASVAETDSSVVSATT
jgi:hypothetical protein